ncbi:uncharacterized protein RAG0_07729 [Rhynchosporium agropyri]|uniref:Uncharacterized protein n=2 Tax=Rhynchosporium TaxID=38037 RepID=A0A1E1LX93_RHYSE|nr:uncharacterized protein RAG0_07729 [Rhynchosporium agropyri]CZT41471.1 uncharacterized protein RSE6_01213 [Rhynchosporium secalis]
MPLQYDVRHDKSVFDMEFPKLREEGLLLLRLERRFERHAGFAANQLATLFGRASALS